MTDIERKAKNNAYMKGYYARNKEKWRAGQLLRDFGITAKQYDEMLSSQSGQCALCETSTPGGKGVFHVDHCHHTGSVRKLLCHSCNTGLGLFKDNADVLIKAAAYIRDHSV